MFERLRKFGNLGYIPLVVWLFVQLSMTGLFSPASASAADAALEADFSNTIVICTSTGLKRITLEDDGSLPADAPDVSSFCPWCMHFGALPSMAPKQDWQPVSLVSTGGVSWFAPDESCISNTPRSHFHRRAPPL